MGIPHHVTQRGNNQQGIFSASTDREVYVTAFEKHAKRRGLRVWGYCLMTNHVHFVVVPEQETSLARTFGGVHSDYARYWNLLHGKNGHLWQGRFYSCPLERTQAWHALAYVERNPVRAGLVDDARIYRWSSAAPHCEGLRSAITIDEHDWQQVYTRARWSKVLTAGVSQEALDDRLRAATMPGVRWDRRSS